ncbi:DNA polymerase III subunit delta [Spirochaetia bacterium]|nr:DNA polymerase III subunit delta [Spirochaetia bacterium]
MPKGECFLFLGPEIGEKQDAITEIRAALSKKHGAPVEEHRFYAGEDAMPDILSVLLNGSLFSDARLIFIKTAEQIKKKDEIENLCSYLSAPLDDTTLIMVSDETSVDKRIEETCDKNNKRIFYEMFENRKGDWIRKFFAKNGFTIEDDAVDAVLEMIENNTDALRRECQALVFFLDGKKDTRISAELVEKLLSHSRSESAFTLFSSITDGNLTKSLDILRSLISGGESPVTVFSGLLWCFRRFRDYCRLAENGAPNEYDLRRIGITMKKSISDYKNASSLFGITNADKIIALCAEYDLRTRTCGTPLTPVLMDMFLIMLFQLSAKNRKNRF